MKKIYTLGQLLCYIGLVFVLTSCNDKNLFVSNQLADEEQTDITSSSINKQDSVSMSPSHEYAETSNLSKTTISGIQLSYQDMIISKGPQVAQLPTITFPDIISDASFYYEVDTASGPGLFYGISFDNDSGAITILSDTDTHDATYVIKATLIDDVYKGTVSGTVRVRITPGTDRTQLSGNLQFAWTGGLGVQKIPYRIVMSHSPNVHITTSGAENITLVYMPSHVFKGINVDINTGKVIVDSQLARAGIYNFIIHAIAEPWNINYTGFISTPTPYSVVVYKQNITGKLEYLDTSVMSGFPANISVKKTLSNNEVLASNVLYEVDTSDGTPHLPNDIFLNRDTGDVYISPNAIPLDDMFTIKGTIIDENYEGIMYGTIAIKISTANTVERVGVQGVLFYTPSSLTVFKENQARVVVGSVPNIIINPVEAKDVPIVYSKSNIIKGIEIDKNTGQISVNTKSVYAGRYNFTIAAVVDQFEPNYTGAITVPYTVVVNKQKFSQNGSLHYQDVRVVSGRGFPTNYPVVFHGIPDEAKIISYHYEIDTSNGKPNILTGMTLNRFTGTISVSPTTAPISNNTYTIKAVANDNVYQGTLFGAINIQVAKKQIITSGTLIYDDIVNFQSYQKRQGLKEIQIDPMEASLQQFVFEIDTDDGNPDFPDGITLDSETGVISISSSTEILNQVYTIKATANNMFFEGSINGKVKIVVKKEEPVTHKDDYSPIFQTDAYNRSTRVDQLYYLQPHNTYNYGSTLKSWLDAGYRTVEIDVIDRGDWEFENKGPYVAHGPSAGDRNCSPNDGRDDRLGDCFDAIFNWLKNNTTDVPIIVYVDMKASWDPAWAWLSDEVNLLDIWIEHYVGDSRMFMSRELQKYVAPLAGSNYRQRVKEVGWPTAYSLRNQIIVALTGGHINSVNQNMHNASINAASFMCPDVDASDEDEISNDIDGLGGKSHRFVCANVEAGDHVQEVLNRSAEWNQLIHIYGDSGDFSDADYSYNFMAVAHGATQISVSYGGVAVPTWVNSIPLVGVRRGLPGYFKIKNSSGSMCATTSGYSNGDDIYMLGCKNTNDSDQQFVYTAEGQIRPRNDNVYCVDIEGGDTPDNANYAYRIHLWDCDGGDSEKWIIQPNGKITSIIDGVYGLFGGRNNTLLLGHSQFQSPWKLQRVADWMPNNH